MKVKAFEALVQELSEHGVHTIFGLMGDANVPIMAEFARDPANRFVTVTHEAAAVSGADGFFRISGQVGVASVTHGPGLTNTLTALTEAVRSRSQVLLLTGDTPSEHTRLQHLDIAAAVHPTGAGYERVYEARTVVADVRRAIHRVQTERRPIVLNFPKSELLLEAEAPSKTLPEVITTVPASLSEHSLELVLDMIAGAKRPLLLAGRGAVSDECRGQLLELATRLKCPVATTLLARDLFRGYPLNIGISGGLGSSLATDVLTEADTLIVFGAGLNRYTTYTGDLTRGKRILHIDTDPEIFGFYTPVSLAVEGDCTRVATQINQALSAADFEGTGWAQKFLGRISEWTPASEYVDKTNDDQIDARSASILLNELLPPDRNVVTDVGRFSVAAWPRISVQNPLRFTHTSNYGSIGLGLGTAIGVSIADPERMTVALLGDGGYMMNCGELSTAVRYQLPLLAIVFNDRSYGSDRSQLTRYGEDPELANMEWPDLANLATAMGAQSISVKNLEDLNAIPRTLTSLQGPCLVDIHLDPSYDSGSW